MVIKTGRTRLTLSLLSTALIAALGCNGSTEPLDDVVLTMNNLAGVYYGVTLTTEEGRVVTDQLRLGATIELILYGEGRTEGRLLIPVETGGCGTADVSLNGSWTLNGNTVTLNLVNESFLQAISMEFSQTQLTGQATKNGVVFRVVLAT
jgi:hypothetical protein